MLFRSQLFAAAYRMNPNLFFLLLAPESDHGKAREWMDRHELPQAAVLLRELPQAAVGAALQQADVGLLLRRADAVNRVSSPTKFGEYLAAGLPVIMTGGIGDYSQLAAESGTGLVLAAEIVEKDGFTPAVIEQVVRYVQECKKEREAVAARCRRVAREYLHWDVAGRNLQQVFQKAFIEA